MTKINRRGFVKAALAASALSAAGWASPARAAPRPGSS
jgi:hypothetical protein